MDHPDDIWVRERSIMDHQSGLVVKPDDPFYTFRNDPTRVFDDEAKEHPEPAELRQARRVKTEPGVALLPQGGSVHFQTDVATVLDAQQQPLTSWPCGEVSLSKSSHYAVVAAAIWVIEVTPLESEGGHTYTFTTHVVSYDLATGRKKGPFCRWADHFVYQPQGHTFYARRAQPCRVDDYRYFTDYVILDATSGAQIFRPTYRLPHVFNGFDDDEE